MAKLTHDISSLPFCCSPADNVDDLVHQYNNGLSSLLDCHAPLITRTVAVRPDNPWHTDEIRQTKCRLRKQEAKWRITGLEIDRQMFRNLRNDANHMCDNAKVAFLNEKIAKNTGKRSLFKLVDSFLLPKSSLRLPRHDSPQMLVDRFGKYFMEKIETIRSSLDANAPPWSPEPPSATSVFTEFSPITVDEVISLIASCPTKTSPRDPMPTHLLKEISTSLAPSIAKLVNLSFSTGVFPDDMKIAFITPLLKKPGLDPDADENYRPISLLSFLSKLLERAAALQLVKYLESNCLFASVQSAYRSNHSTETALVKVLNDILRSIDEGDAVILALLDQSAAFDTVDHGILLHRLSADFGISGTALVWFSSYLSDRRQSVSIAGVSSAPLSLRYGVPQGSVLGPILYILYNTPMHSIASLHGVSDHLYADDDQQYTRFRVSDSADQARAFSSLSTCIGETKQWAATNRLKFNDGKTDALVAYSSYARKKPSLIPLVVGDSSIYPSSSVCNLGVTIDPHVKLDAHIRNVCKKAFFHLRRISRIKRFLSRSSLIRLIQSFVFSHLDYCNSLLAGLPDTSIKRLQNVQNSAARLVTGAKRFDHISTHLIALHWLPVAQRIDFKISLLMFRCLNDCAPSYLSELISRDSNCHAYRLRSETRGDLLVPPTRTKTYGDRAFSVYGPRLWNSLPLSVRSCPTIISFKSKLKTHLFRQAFPQQV